MLKFIFQTQKPQKKIIYHTGAWAGNFGDSILQQSIRENIEALSKYELEFRYINCQKTEFTKPLIEEINSTGDILIVGGGGLVFYRPQDNSKSGWQWNIETSNIDLINIPFIVYGVGYNQFEYDRTDFLPVTNENLKKAVQKASLFSVRNTGTKRELVARGCNEYKIEVIPDSGMFLKPKKIFIPGLDNNRVKIGFNWTTDREDQTFPTPYARNKEMFINACLNLLNYAIIEKKAQIFYIGHMSKEFDSEIIKVLKEGLIEKPIIIDEKLEHIYPPAAERAGFLVDVYRQMDIILGMRGHANIVAFGQNTPFIGIGSHKKIRYFLEDIGRKDYFFDTRPEGDMYSINKMKACLDEIIKNKEKHKDLLRKEFKKQKKKITEFNTKVIKLLE